MRAERGQNCQEQTEVGRKEMVRPSRGARILEIDEGQCTLRGHKPINVCAFELMFVRHLGISTSAEGPFGSERGATARFVCGREFLKESGRQRRGCLGGSAQCGASFGSVTLQACRHQRILICRDNILWTQIRVSCFL